MMNKLVSKEQKTKAITSFQVFQYFITKDEQGRRTGDKIFSKECFHTWLETRKEKIVHPEESFRRTLLAHLRGTDGRQPFDPEIEMSLLNLLRENNHKKKSEKSNPWSRCFDGNKQRIGKRGFNKLGFHEQKKLANSGESLQARVQGSLSPLLKQQLSPTRKRARVDEVIGNSGMSKFGRCFIQNDVITYCDPMLTNLLGADACFTSVYTLLQSLDITCTQVNLLQWRSALIEVRAQGGASTWRQFLINGKPFNVKIQVQSLFPSILLCIFQRIHI
eukprot:maker-scaffold_20-snap-gene-3.37-mRNA-1 protein AED:0.25 eAED:0.25 QI:62/1/1/1/1/1/2/74/275